MSKLLSAYSRVSDFYGILPRALERELRSMASGTVNELRLRVGGVCSVVIGGRNYPLFFKIKREELRELTRVLCHDALYAYKDGISRGYISVGGGVRVGIVGFAKYDGGQVVGIGEISSLAFRFPVGGCDFAEELYSLWEGHGRCSMLIASPPAGGKTTALRHLARLIGSGRDAMRVAVVDERCEFVAGEYESAAVDLLSGYRRADGLEIALRTMSCEVIMVDEIATAEDARAMELAMGVGVPVIATTHGASLPELRRRPLLSQILGSGAFRLGVFIHRGADGFNIEAEEL